LFLTIWSLTQVLLCKIRIPLLVWFVVGFIIISGFVVGITVPNFGALVRIRVFYECFLVLLVLIIPCQWLQKVITKANEKTRS
jgi:hypothetical protein